jgi:hypothetical protein
MLSGVKSLIRRPAAADSRAPIHFLHIGKTAGTQFELGADQINARNDRWRIIKENHLTDLRNLKLGDHFLFSIRAPHGRFMSGFYSRKRQGRPRYDNPWSPYEAQAFAWFDHANDLAEALFAEGEAGYRAMCALQSIGHLAKGQIDWFAKTGTFFEVHPPMAILRQEHFKADMAAFLARIGVDPASVALDSDPDRAHRTDYADIPPLSDKARANLRRWYAQDYEFHKWCEAWIAAHQAG